MARRQGLFWANAERVTRVTVRRPSQSVSAESLAALIADTLSRQELASYAVTLANLQPLHAPMDLALAPDIVALSLDPSTRTFVAEIALAPGLPPQRIIGRAEPSVALPVLTRAVARGAAIAEGDLGFVETPATRVPADALTDPSESVGLAARRALRPGVAIKSFDLALPTIIARGEVVIVRFERGALALTARARALDDVAQGEQARFVNLHSSRVIEAVATGPGEAWLVAAAPGGGAGGSR
jgi:flagella basal body P-ring formation protein FlgA